MFLNNESLYGIRVNDNNNNLLCNNYKQMEANRYQVNYVA